MNIEEFKANIKWVTEPQVTGGQTVSYGRALPVTLISEELDIKITVGYYRSNSKNKELALTLFELAASELTT